MKRKSFIKLFLSLLGVGIIFFAGCKNSLVAPPSSVPTSDQQAMTQLIANDSSLNSFYANYNEDQAMSFIGKTNAAIYPLKVGQRVHLVNRNIDFTTVGDSTYAKVTNTYEGVLYIAATYTASQDTADTLIQKPFTSVITRNVIFIKVQNPKIPNDTLYHWRIAAISLASGGVLSPNIDIKKVTLYFPDGDTLMVSDPGSYYIDTFWGWRRSWCRRLPIIVTARPIKVDVELYSAYNDSDFVTLTYGGNLRGLHRAKKKFVLISSTPSGNGYDKVYEQTYETSQWPGFYHAIINAFPHQVIYDDSAGVETSTWGIPYFVL